MKNSQTVRWLVIFVLGLATAVMVAASLRANYLFGYGFGQSAETAQVFGWTNVGADLWKVTGLIVITALWRGERKRFAALLFPVWVVCLGWGLAGAVGVYAQDRTTLIGGREAKAATYKDKERELAEIDAKLQTLTSQRSVVQVDAAIAAVYARPVMIADRVRGTVGSLSGNCTKDHRASADACLEVARLREERASAEERARFESRQVVVRKDLTRMREGGGSLTADPVAELFAWLSRGQLSVRDIAFGFPLFFAFLIEIVSAFGPAGIVAYAEATRGESEVSLPQHAAAGLSRLTVVGRAEPENGSVMQWLVERGRPGDGAISAEDLHADYQLWCRRTGVPAAAFENFVMLFDFVRDDPELKLGDKIRKFGQRYYGIRLVDAKVVMVTARK